MKKKELKTEINRLKFKISALENRIKVLEIANAARRYHDLGGNDRLWYMKPMCSAIEADGIWRKEGKNTWSTPWFDDDDPWDIAITYSEL